MDRDKSGIVFNEQKFTLHDGKGIRTMVFLKGCPLRCLWCSNPESQSPLPEKAYNPSRCLTACLCGLCVQTCPRKAIQVENDIIVNDVSGCEACFQCVDGCPAGARVCYGYARTVDEVLRDVERDNLLYHRSEGGLTVSGGEPTAQPEFALALLREAKRRHIDTVMETCGLCHGAILREACALLDMLIFDVKHADPLKHKAFTGAGNGRILENLHTIARQFPSLPILVRSPVVPGVNDTEEEVRGILDVLPQRDALAYELLPYHRMGVPKYAHLGRSYEIPSAKLDEALFHRLRSLAAARYPATLP